LRPRKSEKGADFNVEIRALFAFAFPGRAKHAFAVHPLAARKTPVEKPHAPFLERGSRRSTSPILQCRAKNLIFRREVLFFRSRNFQSEDETLRVLGRETRAEDARILSRKRRQIRRKPDRLTGFVSKRGKKSPGKKDFPPRQYSVMSRRI
jgi:hypothetical protein